MVTDDHRLSRIEGDIQSLSTRLQAVEINQATSENDRVHMDRRFDALDKKVDEEFREQRANTKRLIWLIVGLIVSAVFTFIVDGGLNVGNP